MLSHRLAQAIGHKSCVHRDVARVILHITQSVGGFDTLSAATFEIQEVQLQPVTRHGSRVMYVSLLCSSLSPSGMDRSHAERYCAGLMGLPFGDTGLPFGDTGVDVDLSEATLSEAIVAVAVPAYMAALVSFTNRSTLISDLCKLEKEAGDDTRQKGIGDDDDDDEGDTDCCIDEIRAEYAI